MAEYSAAIDYYVDASRVFAGQNSCEVIVLHGTGGQNPDQTAQQLGDYFRTNAEITSVHYGIDRNGVVAQYVREGDGAGGNCCTDVGYDPFWQPFLNKYGNLNLCTISIEHEQNIDNSLPLSDAQKMASFKLVAYLSKKYNIAPDHIKSHASIAPINRARCPGNYPWSDLWAYLKGQTMLIPQGWTDNGTTLTAPNRVPVVRGFRDHILSAGNWDAGNVPQNAELPANPVQLHNIALGGGTIQPFRDCILWWTSSKGVVEEPFSGLEIWACYQKIATLEQQSISPVSTVADAANTVSTCITLLQAAQKKLLS